MIWRFHAKDLFLCFSAALALFVFRKKSSSLFSLSPLFFFPKHIFFLGHFRIKFLLQNFLFTQYEALKLDENKSLESIWFKTTRFFRFKT